MTDTAHRADSNTSFRVPDALWRTAGSGSSYRAVPAPDCPLGTADVEAVVSLPGLMRHEAKTRHPRSSRLRLLAAPTSDPLSQDSRKEPNHA